MMKKGLPVPKQRRDSILLPTSLRDCEVEQKVEEFFQLQRYTPSRTAQHFPAAATTMLVASYSNTSNSTGFCSRMSGHKRP